MKSKNFILFAVGALVGLSLFSQILIAGSVDGRQRWTHRNTSIIKGKVKAHPPILIPKNGQKELRIVFRANEFAEFMVIGDGDADINLYVYDAKGKLIEKDVDPPKRGSDLCLCEWTPKKTQEYRIVLKNVSNIASICQAGCN